MKITLTEFAGISPMLDTRILNEKACLLAHNMNVESGKAVPYWIDVTGWENGANNGNSVTSPVNELRREKTYSISTTTTGEFGSLLCNGSAVSKEVPASAPTATVTSRYTGTIGVISARYIYAESSIAISKEQSTDIDSLDVKAKAKFAAWIDPITSTGESSLRRIYFAKKSGTLYVSYNTLPSGSSTVATTSSTIDYRESGTQSGSVDIPLGDQSNTPYARISLSSVSMDKITSPSAPEHGEYFAYQGCTHHYNIKIRYSYPLETRYYMWTYYYGGTGEAFESPNSPISGIVQCRRGDIVKVNITGIPNTAKGIYIYRTAGSNKGGSASFYLCKELVKTTDYTGTTAEFVDDVLNSQLGEKHMDIQNPPTNILAGTLYKVNGSLVVAAKSAGTKTQSIWLSEPYMPYDFPVANNYTVDDEIKSLSVVGNTVIILTDKNAYTLTGSTAVAMTLKKSVYEYPCASANSVVSADGVTYYASTDGIICVTPNGDCKNITENVFTKEQWNFMMPEDMIFYVKGNTLAIKVKERSLGDGDTQREYYLLWDMTKKNMTTQQLTEPTTAAPLELTWRSKIFTFDTPLAPSVARIITSYQKTGETKFRIIAVSRETTTTATESKPYSLFSLPAHAVQVYPTTEGTYVNVLNDKAFRLPHLRRELAYMIEVVSKNKIVRVDLATSMGELSYVNDRQE